MWKRQGCMNEDIMQMYSEKGVKTNNLVISTEGVKSVESKKCRNKALKSYCPCVEYRQRIPLASYFHSVSLLCKYIVLISLSKKLLLFFHFKTFNSLLKAKTLSKGISKVNNYVKCWYIPFDWPTKLYPFLTSSGWYNIFDRIVWLYCTLPHKTWCKCTLNNGETKPVWGCIVHWTFVETAVHSNTLTKYVLATGFR